MLRPGVRRFRFYGPVLACIFLTNFVMFLLLSYTRIPDEKVPQVSNYAYITLANNEAYAKGALTLAMSLIEVESLYPLVVLVTKDVPSPLIRALNGIGCLVYPTDSVTLPPELSLETARWGPAFTKLTAWKRTEYSKLVFMDSDLLVLQNVDHLFATADDQTLLATVDADASSCSYNEERLSLINSGVMVLTPSSPTYSRLISTLHNKTLLAQGPMNDQDVIVHTMPWEGLPYPNYGAQVTHCECSDKRLWDLDNTKIIHFTAGLLKIPKPWEYAINPQKYHTVPSCVIYLYEVWKTLYENALHMSLPLMKG